MKIVSWNVNGLKAITKKGALESVLSYDAILLQEIRSSDLPLDLLMSGYNIVSFPAKKKGYSGVMTLVKEKPKSVVKGLNQKEFDEEGRTVTVELSNFYLINAYFPRAGDGLSRLDFKIAFDKKIEEFMDELRKTKPVIICGDFNAVVERRDSSFWDENEPGLSPKEREWMAHILSKGYVDAYRFKNPNKIEYSWRSYRFKWKAMRIDYCIVSEELKDKIKDCKILNIEGSDHYPILLEIDV
ncbi:exodeoxyribonuclease III [Sulfurisphaera javensis]|uniref:Exodeoxyribonuclease III n=1 Tax=Sulfurisphaera javensis TaxID=2049879 RepID=A0AAT9GNN6_9CREN